MYLVDTDVISATAPTKARPRDDIRDWLKARSERIFLSAISLMELRRGIALLKAKGHSRKARQIEVWEHDLAESFASRILTIDRDVAQMGDLFGRAESTGTFPGLPDSCIAATAHHHGLMVVTANVRHFRALGVAYCPLWSPGEEGPP